MCQILKMGIDNRKEFNALPEDDAWDFLRALFDASDTFFAIWPETNEAHGGFLRVKHRPLRRQAIGAFLVEDRQFAEAWKAMQDQAEAAPEFFHEMPGAIQ